jgi:hypothetical protein
MGFNDIRPYKYGHNRPALESYPLAAAGNFVVGNPVRLNAAGFLVECADAPVADNILGIAQASGDVDGSILAAGIFPNITYPTTGSDRFPNTGDMVPVAIPDSDTLFIVNADRFSEAGAAFGDVVPTAAHAGQACGIALIGGNFGIELAGVLIGRVHEVLNANGRSVGSEGGTGVAVIFSINAHQRTATGTTADPAA